MVKRPKNRERTARGQAVQQMRDKQHKRRGAETEEQGGDRLQQMRLHSTAAQSVHHTFSNHLLG